MLKIITVEKYFQIAADILTEALNNSDVGDILCNNSLAGAITLIPQNTKESVIKIIKFAAVNSSETYLKQINNQDSIFCLKITELIAAVGVKFNVFILENSEYSSVILKLLIMCVSHHNRKISYFAFAFWTAFRTVISQVYQDLLKHMDCSFIAEAYMHVLNCLLQNCKRTVITSIKDTTGKGKKIKVIDLDGEDEDDGGFGKEEEDDVTRMTLRDYRTHADDVFYSVYDVLNKLRGETGVKEVFTKLAVLLEQQNVAQKDTPEYTNYITNCEVAIVAINAMIDCMDVQIKNPYICELMKALIRLPDEEIIIAVTLQFLYECDAQLPFIGSEAATQVFQYLLNNVLKPSVSYLASQVIT